MAFVFNPFTGTFDIDTTSSSTDGTTSADGEYSVPSGSAVGDLMYANGALSADVADNGSEATIPAIGMIIAKPTSTTATVKYVGKVGGFTGLTTGSDYFLGTSGGIILAASLPTAAGSVIQNIGVAVSTTEILLNIKLPVVV